MNCTFAVPSVSANLGAVSKKNRLIFTASPLTVLATSPDVTVPKVPQLSPIQYIRHSVDERSLAVATGDVIRLLDTVTGRDLRTLVGHRLPVTCIAPFNKNIYQYASGSTDGVCNLWDVRRHPANSLVLRCGGPVNCIALSPDDRVMAVGSHFALHLLDITSKKVFKQYNNFSFLGLSFHPSEMLLASFGVDRMVRIWDLDSFECISVSPIFDVPIDRIEFTPNGDSLLVCTSTDVHMMSFEPCIILGTKKFPNFCKVLDTVTSEDYLEILCQVADSMVLYRVEYLDILSADSTTSESTSLETAEETGRSSSSLAVSSEESAGESRTPSTTESIPSVQDSENSDEQPVFPDSEEDEQFASYADPVKERPTARNVAPKQKTQSHRAATAASHLRKKPPMGSRPSKSIDNGKGMPRPKTLSDSCGAGTKMMNTRKRSPSETGAQSRGPSPLPTITEESLMAKIVSRHAAVVMDLDEKQRSINRLADTAKRRGLEDAARQAAPNNFLTCQFLNQVNARSKWTLALCELMLPRIRNLFQSDLAWARKTALTSLSNIVTGQLEAIRHFSAYRPTIGVDVAAEARKECATRCHNALLDMHVNQAFLVDKLSDVDKTEFDALIGLVSPI